MPVILAVQKRYPLKTVAPYCLTDVYTEHLPKYLSGTTNMWNLLIVPHGTATISLADAQLFRLRKTRPGIQMDSRVSSCQGQISAWRAVPRVVILSERSESKDLCTNFIANEEQTRRLFDSVLRTPLRMTCLMATPQLPDKLQFNVPS